MYRSVLVQKSLRDYKWRPYEIPIQQPHTIFSDLRLIDKILSSAQCMKTTEFSITSGSDVQIDQDSCTPADWFLNRIVRQQQSDQNLPFLPHHTVATAVGTMYRQGVGLRARGRTYYYSTFYRSSTVVSQIRPPS